MRYLVSLLAVAGFVVSILAFQVHYSTTTAPCDINEKWDCGIVNHSPFAMIGPVPVAALGIAGYALLAFLGFRRHKRLLITAIVPAFGYSIYLTSIEKFALSVWCVYCVTSLGIICLLTLLALAWQFFPDRKKP
ncbi:vitamin K epoxide reductase family protein [Acidicapsa dinghuensis]|uniref:Vitamin K epoxide reductase family protein n=1 Tax=Acidicapsa dinghuensis TaxID=2218256 RepID=A0ABW1EA19_9BACT|nr:vitamin K epoxide reductase family protein [Acidicapsa dinghuensis]